MSAVSSSLLFFCILFTACIEQNTKNGRSKNGESKKTRAKIIDTQMKKKYKNEKCESNDFFVIKANFIWCLLYGESNCFNYIMWYLSRAGLQHPIYNTSTTCAIYSSCHACVWEWERAVSVNIVYLFYHVNGEADEMLFYDFCDGIRRKFETMPCTTYQHCLLASQAQRR